MMKYDVSQRTDTTHDASMTSTTLPFHAWEEDADVIVAAAGSSGRFLWNHPNNNPRLRSSPDEAARIDDDDHNNDDYSIGVDVLAAEGGGKQSFDASASSSTTPAFSQFLRFKAGRILTQYHVKRGILILIFIVLILLTIRTFYLPKEHDNDDNPNEQAITIIDNILQGIWWIFALEVTLALAFYQWHALQRGWVWVDIILLGVAYGHHPAILGLRGFQLLRILRKATGIPSVVWAVKSVLRSLPRLVAVLGVLLPGTLFIFAVLFTNLYRQTSDSLFGRIDVSAFTLFQIMTGGILWGDIYAELQDSQQHPHAWLSLLVYVIVAVFIAGSLIIAIMCDTVSMIQNRDYQFGFQTNTTTAIPHATTGAPTTVSLDPQPPSIRNLEHALLYGPTTLNTKMGTFTTKTAIPAATTTISTRLDLPEKSTVGIQSKDDIHRLERKVDHLMVTIEQLVKLQTQLQESVRDMQISSSSFKSSAAAPAAPSTTIVTKKTETDNDDDNDDWSDYDSARPVLSRSQSTTLS